MLLVFGFVLLVLAAAVVVLFAMMGELASRMPASGTRTSWVRALEEALVGRAPSTWPPELAHVTKAHRGVLLVLSTICRSCETVAAELSAEHAGNNGMALVVSTSGRGKADDFITRHGLGAFPCFIDELGEWTSNEFAVRTSPAALVFRDGTLTSAYVFSDLSAFHRALDDETTEFETREAV